MNNKKEIKNKIDSAIEWVDLLSSEIPINSDGRTTPAEKTLSGLRQDLEDVLAIIKKID